ncbi:MAG: hypothetical protein DHS20C05_15590 [Hyphococcus sp.]|nr:MAG: hypothetical protein DHS20C05_15590 [Marinicaulis sp.]
MTTSLLIENTYLAFSILILSSLYKFTRDWVRHQYERRTYQDETESLRQALQQTRHEMHVLSSAGNPSSFLQINSGNEKLQIPTSTILYIKSAGNYADIFTPNQSYLAYGAMKDFIEKLPQKRFSRIHRSYIVGMEHIHMIKGSAIYLNDVKLPLGASYKKSFFQKWNERSQTEVDKPKSI